MGPMTSQAPPDSLFARARAEDPVTSHASSAALNRSGKAACDAALVLDVLREHPGLTYRELHTHVIGMEATDVMKRLCDLEHKGLVRKVGSRLCTVGVRAASTWEVA